MRYGSTLLLSLQECVCLPICLKIADHKIHVVEAIMRYRVLANGIHKTSSIKLGLNAKVIKIIIKTLIFSAQLINTTLQSTVYSVAFFSQDSKTPVMICITAKLKISQDILLAIKRNSSNANKKLF